MLESFGDTFRVPPTSQQRSSCLRYSSLPARLRETYIIRNWYSPAEPWKAFRVAFFLFLFLCATCRDIEPSTGIEFLRFFLLPL